MKKTCKNSNFKYNFDNNNPLHDREDDDFLPDLDEKNDDDA